MRLWKGDDRRWRATMAAILLMCGLACAQFGPSKIQRPDEYTFAPPLEYVTRYEWDEKGKTITNADFFCTACAQEGRIPFADRDDIKDRLETERRYSFDVDGQRTYHFGKFRLAAERADHVLRYLFDELETKNPVFIEDGLFRLFTDLPALKWLADPNPRREIELTQLRDVFPDVAERPSRLTPHQRAHLYLIRAHRIRRDFEHLVKHDPKAAYMQFNGPYLGCRQKFEFYVFARQKEVGRFVASYFDTGAKDKIYGIIEHPVRDDAVIAAFSIDDSRDAWIHNAFTHRLSLAFMVAYRGYYFEMPGWLSHGWGHLMERRERTDFNTFVVGNDLLGQSWRESDWKRAVRRQVTNKKYPRFASLAQNMGMTGFPPDMRGIVWSLFSFLVQQDQEKVGKLIHYIKNRPEGGDTYAWQVKAFDRVYGKTFDQIEDEWVDWVKETYPP